MVKIGRLLGRFCRGTSGQDLVEYALLAALIGVAAAASAPLITTALGSAYTAWNQQTQQQWRMPDPGAGS